MRYEDFEKILQDDLAWRKKEISELYLIASDKQNKVLLKSLILVLYAHWEGYVKQSSKLYIKYICEKKVHLCDLTSNFKAIALKLNISNIVDTKEKFTLSNEIRFMEKYEDMQVKKFKVKMDINDEFDKKIINTHDNLNPKVFKNILSILGVKYLDSFASREKYIDKNLLGNRNAIGHGSKFDSENQENFELNINDVGVLKKFIIEVLDFYTNIMLDYIIDEYYLIKNSENKDKYDVEKNCEFEKIIEKLEQTNVVETM